MNFRLWLETQSNKRHMYCQIIQALVKKDRATLGALGDWLQDHGDTLGEYVSRMSGGSNVDITAITPEKPGRGYYRRHKAFFREDDGYGSYYSFGDDTQQTQDPFVASFHYKPNQNEYLIGLRLDIEPEPVEFYWNLDTNKVSNGENTLLKKMEIYKGFSDEMIAPGEEPYESDRNFLSAIAELPDYLPAPPPSEKALRDLMEGMIYHLNGGKMD